MGSHYQHQGWVGSGQPHQQLQSVQHVAHQCFPAESFMAADRKPFHKKCVKCKSCNKVLTSATLNEHETQLYCKACYDNIFMLMAIGGGQYEGIITPEDLRRMEEEEKKRLQKAKRAKEERRRCP